jgi:protein gp37
MTLRLQGTKLGKYAKGFDQVVVHPEALMEPLKRMKPTTVFVESMGDVFHKDVPEEFILQVFDVMNCCPQHQFQVLTKRSERLAEISPLVTWTKNIWAGVTVENADYVHRIDDLRQTGAHVKFLSLEPLLGPIPVLNLNGIDWVIVGGETGPGARAMEPEWVMDLRDQCIRSKVAYFFKQWGGFGKGSHERLLDGRIWDQMPQVDER